MAMYLDKDQVQELKDKNYGIFVVFEGPDGSGKSTLIAMVGEAIRQATTKVVVTQEPYFPSIRKWLLEDHTPAAMALVMIGDRIDHLVKVVIPSLNSDDIVLSSRYDASTMVYNVVCGDLDVSLVDPIQKLQGLLPVPDIYVYAHAPSSVLQERVNRRETTGDDRDDSDMSQSFLERVSDGYAAFFEVWEKCHGAESLIKVRTDVPMNKMQELAEEIAAQVIGLWRDRKAIVDA